MSKKSFVFGTATITMALFSGLVTGCQLQSDQTVKTSLDVNNASVANLSALAPESRGDVDGDGSINAVDASLILIAASCIGSGEEPGLTAEQAFAADYNEDDILPSIAKHNIVVLCRLRSSRQSHYVALAEGV